ncbi:hypothetical protein M5K25_009366 [Dendrobium thyrsiflorum]|uniref:RING-type domain-containing protein n=1 Tax=Dendrobium thyrsiflorum TaxID=117978 RepID=A0ABD0V599_DENTH
MPNEEDFNESMSLRTRRHPTPAVLASAAKPKGGARLLSILLRFIVMHIVLSFFFLFAGIAVFILILLCIAGKVLRHRRRRRFFLQPDIERRGLSREEIRCLPCFRSSELVSDDCVVCLEGFREGDWCRVLPGCKHLFHRICVDRWLERSKVCPICRGGVAAGWI